MKIGNIAIDNSIYNIKGMEHPTLHTHCSCCGAMCLNLTQWGCREQHKKHFTYSVGQLYFSENNLRFSTIQRILLYYIYNI